MASAPSTGPAPQPSPEVRAFAAAQHGAAGASRFGIGVDEFATLLAEVVTRSGGSREILPFLHLEELVLARACMAGNEHAWELLLTHYRAGLYEAAYKIAHDEATARVLADSLYGELYGVDDRGQARASKLRYYLGRGSLAGWLRTVLAQEYVNKYRRTRRETSLEEQVEAGHQFEASQPENATSDTRVEAATAAELAALDPEEHLVLAAYYLDHRTLAEIAKLLRVHESTVSRRLERTTAGLRKRIRKRLLAAGMSARQADEALKDVDVRDMKVNVRQTLQQDSGGMAFYKKGGEEG
jgi:RNA polymerase sigma-70 factor (ECF subfamily)